jgi:L-ascorbate 6-phosphate lactonase
MSFSLIWYGQAGYLLSVGGCSILIDPYFSDSIASQGFIRLYDSPVKKGELKVDYVFSTHHHGDHLDMETLRDFIEFGNFYGPDSCVPILNSADFPNEKIHRFNRGDTLNLKDIKIDAVFADHTDDSIGIIFEYEGIRLYFSGDSKMNKKLYDVKSFRPDILFVCINGKFGNMTWQEAVVLAHTLKVKAVIPNHYDLFAINMEDPMLFLDVFQRSNIHCWIMDRGKSYDVLSLLKGM